MSTDIGRETTHYQVDNKQWLLDIHGTDYTPNATLDISLFTAAGTNEVQTLTISGSPTGGTFTATFGGETTDDIAHNASAATVEDELEGLSTIGAGNVTVTGSAGGPYTVTFINALGQRNVAQLTVAHEFTGGSSPNITPATVTPGVNSHFPDGYIPSGTVIGRVTSTGLYGPYSDSANDGREVARGLTFAKVIARRANGSLASQVGTGRLIHGFVSPAKLPFQSGPGSLDAAAVADLPGIRFES
ncbi:head decoration protein [Nocardia puris]|uniref:Bacteriophage lambda head decoration protein D n=1 Tax=Nocardia puris TaxID=208602 RepID=A0A366DAF0_9NOCA|nr:head decoration protein [Nocardia puris]RBO87032.1 hypothetical protein DFR74_112209 [Nocardia puris]